MAERRHMLPVWFFIGLLTAYGIIVLAASLSNWSARPTAMLAEYHPGVWGGLVLLLIGGFYVHHFRPRKDR